MKLKLKLVSVLAGVWLVAAQAQAQSALCDRLATHPDDPDRVTAGLENDEIDLPAAEKACRAAVMENPRHARSQYLLGRALFYQGKTEEGIAALKIASDIGYRQAVFVLGYVLSGDIRKPGDDCQAGELWLRSAGLDHPWSGFHLVDKTIAGRFANCRFKLSAAELERYMRLAEDNITLTSSAGRVEALRARLKATKHTSSE